MKEFKRKKEKFKLRLEAVITINYLVGVMQVVLNEITAEKIKNDQEVTADYRLRSGVSVHRQPPESNEERVSPTMLSKRLLADSMLIGLP